MNVFCEILPWTKWGEPKEAKGIILSGSPFSVREPQAPQPDLALLKGKMPILGICYGAQLLAHQFGGEVAASNTREYGRAMFQPAFGDVLMQGISAPTQVWMSHGDSISRLPNNAVCIGSTEDVVNAAYRFRDEATFGVQFHPEVYHSLEGMQLLKNFVLNVCGCSGDWTPGAFIEEQVSALRSKIGSDKVIMGLSGGVDSSVAATLLHRAIGDQLHCIFVDNGLLRKDEYLQALSGLTDPEAKRKAIGRVFIEVFDEESSAVEQARWLGQGTIYPDVIESISATGGPSQTIKSHHNVGGLPDFMKLSVVEPLRSLFKDEVRRIGAALEMDANLLGRHPFPGPGLGIRILGEVTAEKVRLLQEADAIFIGHLRKEGLYDSVWQAGVILLPVQSVGVMGDERTYENAVALRAVTSTDGMTADWCHLPYDFLAEVSNRIINQVRGINRVTYDISSKPPATIEWE
jgi:GMP synthase (glutamine-hydrolysing)